MANHTEPTEINEWERLQAREKWLGSMLEILRKRLHGFLKETTQHKLESLGYSLHQFDEKHFDRVMKPEWSVLWRRYCRDQFSVDFPFRYPIVEEIEKSIKNWDGLEKALKQFLYPVCTKLALSADRDTLSEWVGKVEKGKALFVDALMGLGKTHSIVEALANNENLSAVIFMPTNRLCQDLSKDLKKKIAENMGRDDLYDYVESNEQTILPNKGQTIVPSLNMTSRYFTREYLEDEVYWADGINETDCPHYTAFIARYKENWINKKDICDECAKAKGCRFRLHRIKAPLSRVVITTHQQYDYWYKNSSIRKWFKSGYDNKEDAVERDFFIVDEDLVLSQCYQPTSLTPAQTKAFVSTITTFLEQDKNTGDIREKLYSLLGKIYLCDKTALIRPIDSKFKFPSKIKDDWNKSLPEQSDILPETLDWDDTVGNHLELVESAIRLGFVVQKYEQHNKDKKRGKEQIYRVYFPNSKTYDLSRLPPHVFFDGTMLGKQFLKNKLLKVKFKKHPIEVKPIWQVRIWQNINNDLPRSRVDKLVPKIKDFVRQVIKDIHGEHKYLFISTKKLKKEHLEAFLDDEYPDLFKVEMSYGSLKGLNEAEECDICIMLGSYTLSDAVEITMALEHIQDVFPDQDITLTEGNLWSWKEKEGIRTYKEKYAIIGELMRAVRHSEQRQALARTRYLFHDVDFYIVSKDRVNDYGTEKGFDPFLPKAETEQYLSTIFPPRPTKENSRYIKLIPIIEDRIKSKEPITRKIIFDNYGKQLKIKRIDTIGKHLRRLADEGFLVKKGNSYYASTEEKP